MHKLLKGEFVLFEFEDYDYNNEGAITEGPDYGVLQLFDCVLKVPIGSFKVGDLVPVIMIDFSPGGTLQVFGEDETLLSEHHYSCIMYDLEEKRIISSGKIRELLQVNTNVDTSRETTVFSG